MESRKLLTLGKAVEITSAEKPYIDGRNELIEYTGKNKTGWSVGVRGDSIIVGIPQYGLTIKETEEEIKIDEVGDVGTHGSSSTLAKDNPLNLKALIESSPGIKIFVEGKQYEIMDPKAFAEALYGGIKEEHNGFGFVKHNIDDPDGFTVEEKSLEMYSLRR